MKKNLCASAPYEALREISSHLLEFGRNAGMHTVFVKTTKPQQPLPHPAIDIAFDDLLDFARQLA